MLIRYRWRGYGYMRDKGRCKKYKCRECVKKLCSTTGETSPFIVEVGLHQRTGVGPFLFLILMDANVIKGVRRYTIELRETRSNTLEKEEWG